MLQSYRSSSCQPLSWQDIWGRRGFSEGSWKGLLSLTVVLFVVLIPFFGFGELRRVFGEDMVVAFWRPRRLLHLESRRASNEE